MGAGMARICARYDESDNLKPPCSDLHTEMDKTATLHGSQTKFAVISHPVVAASFSGCGVYTQSCPSQCSLLWTHTGWLWQIKPTRYMAITFGGWHELRQRGRSWRKEKLRQTERSPDGWWDISGVTVPSKWVCEEMPCIKSHHMHVCSIDVNIFKCCRCR